MQIKVEDILPNKSYTHENVIKEEINNKLLVYYLTRYQNGKLKSIRFQPNKALIPKEIDISDKFVQYMGLYQGDGQKSIKSKSYQSTRFSNSEPILLKMFLKFLDGLGVNLMDLKYNLRISRNIQLNEDQLKEYWKQTLNIQKNNFYKIQWRDNKYKDSRVAHYGTLTIIYSNSSFRIIIDSLLFNIKKQALKDKSIAANFLKGLIAADGNVYYKNSHREVSIAAKNQLDGVYIKSLFKKLNILNNKDNITKGKESVRVSGYSNFKIIEIYGLCNTHPYKKSNFDFLITSYKNKCRRKGTSHKLVLNILKNKPLTIRQIAKKLDRRNNTARRYLNILEKRLEVKKIKIITNENNKGRIPFRWAKI